MLFAAPIFADDGHDLWLKYNKIEDAQLLNNYQKIIKACFVAGNSEIIEAVKTELGVALPGLLNKQFSEGISYNSLIVAKYDEIKKDLTVDLNDKVSKLGQEGYLIKSLKIKGKPATLITAGEDIGLLYGTFHFLRLLQTGQNIENLDILEAPKIQLRVLNHWDNLDRTVERGYAGFSIWDWHRLPELKHQYYTDYARANASVGINGTVLNNVNADPLFLTSRYLEKVAALADIFRPYGVRVYLSVKFSSPSLIDGLDTSDPLDPEVKKWWADKVKEIYEFIPDFGGFLVKANSEGQPGPQNYGRTHAEGANMLADALKPYDGAVMWRAFVYQSENTEDRAKQAYNEFKPLDGEFRDNVLVQVKNGPIDFQPREPFHPLFGGMPKTPLMMEFQITMEYLGQGTHLVYLAPLYKEVLESDTYAKGEGSTVATVIDGTLDDHKISGIAGVANIGTDRNWTGHLFGQSSWYGFGRLAWNHQLTSEKIAKEWIKMTISRDEKTVEKIENMMMSSRENVVNYLTPLGLHHMMGWDHHYGPAPWIANKPRPEWTSVYYHQADKKGIGFDRTATGSNAVEQYHKPVADCFASLKTCPEKYLLWFHHLNWDYGMKSGKTLWEELALHYYAGADSVARMVEEWQALKGKIDREIFKHVNEMMTIQMEEARWWRNSCVLYFQSFSNRPLPKELEKPDKTLEYYQKLTFPYGNSTF
jgi:alpha-glucuronidase